MGADAGVHLRLRETVAAAEGEEAALELAAGEVVGLEIVRGDQAQIQGAADGTSENLPGGGAVEVSERSLHLDTHLAA